jgi:hypothetical protein
MLNEKLLLLLAFNIQHSPEPPPQPSPGVQGEAEASRHKTMILFGFYSVSPLTLKAVIMGSVIPLGGYAPWDTRKLAT